ncbi:MAG: hypothetical protein LUF30_06560 [Lachnospiraceae bacterium]|nr:hypothetical protein [Lachnospiraceae bacterium]
MDRFDEMVEALKTDNRVPDQVWAKYTDTLRNLPDKAPTAKRIAARRVKYAAVLAASIGVLTGTVVYAANTSGLFEYLAEFMGQADVEEGLLGEPDDVLTQSEAVGSYEQLWTITDTWYDGAKVYFYAETPESIVQDDNLKVTPSDHMTVNGEDHLLTSMARSDGTYLCWVDVSDIDTAETLELSVRLKLLRNKYNWAQYSLSTDGENGYDYASDVTVEEEQTITFTISGTSVSKTGSLETVRMEQGEVEITKAVLSPSTLKLSFTYRLSGEDAEENMASLTGMFYIEDASGNRIDAVSEEVYETYTDTDGALCIDFGFNVNLQSTASGSDEQEMLDADTSALTIIPYVQETDGEGTYIPGTESELGWGSFTITF